MRHIEGVTSRQMLLDDGYSAGQIGRMLDEGRIVVDQRSVFLLEGMPSDRRRRLLSGLLAVGGPVAVTGADALWVRGLGPEPTGPIDVIVPHPRNPTRRKHVRVRATTRFELADVERIGVVPVVGAAWAVGDFARWSSDEALALLLVSSVRDRWTQLDQVEAVAAARGVFPGCRRLAEVLDHVRDDTPFSRTERTLARALRRRGVDVSLNVSIVDDRGVRIAKVDLLIGSLAIEVDGPHHWLPDQMVADRRRDRLLTELGYVVRRFSAYEVDRDLGRVVAEILQLVATHA